jgi:hypothetical protein
LWNLDLGRISALLPEGLGELAVESGTCRGNGARALAKRFERVITVELSAELHVLARQRFEREGLKQVEAVRGSSASVLEKMLPALASPKPIFFFLDAHWSGDHSVDWSTSSWKGYGLDTAHLGGEGRLPSSREQCPLEEELAVIMKHWAGAAHILIDDVGNIPREGMLASPRFAGENWSHLSRERLLGLVGARLERIYELHDPEQWLLVLKARQKTLRGITPRHS